MLLTGCSKDDPEGNDPGRTDSGGIRFEMNIGAMTRVTTEGTSYRSKWEAGDEVNICAVKSGIPLSVINCYIYNAKLVFDGTEWTYQGPDIYYPLDGSELDFYAFYPYMDIAYDPAAANFPKIGVNAFIDQSTQENFNKSEFLSAVALNQKAQTVRLDFTHSMALVEVRVDRVAPVQAFRGDALTVTLKDVYSNGILYWATGAAEANINDSKSDVKMYRVATDDGSYVYRALVPAQDKAAGTLFRFEQYSASKDGLAEIDMVYETDPVTLKDGEASVWAITLDYGLEPDHKYKVGDYYPYKGTPVGVVYWIDPAAEGYTAASGGNPATGMYGKIVSLDEANTFHGGSIYGIAWCRYHVTTNATDQDDGRANMKAVYESNSNSFDIYPAFDWVHSHNPSGTVYTADATGIWYLPARNELRALNAGCSGKVYEEIAWDDYSAMPDYNTVDAQNARTAFNTTLTSVGGEPLYDITWPYYWSSTERNNASALNVFFGNALINNDMKEVVFRVRAVMAF